MDGRQELAGLAPVTRETVVDSNERIYFKHFWHLAHQSGHGQTFEKDEARDIGVF